MCFIYGACLAWRVSPPSINSKGISEINIVFLNFSVVPRVSGLLFKPTVSAYFIWVRRVAFNPRKIGRDTRRCLKLLALNVVYLMQKC